MLPSERFFIIGLLKILRPSTILEVGYAWGGCTEWLCETGAEVTTVDIEPQVTYDSRRFKHVRPLHMSCKDAFALLKNEGKHFDLCIIDAGHSEESAFNDLREAIPLADVILMHDTGHPESRSGYKRALLEHDVFHNLDVIDGHFVGDDLWGGIGVVLTTERMSSLERPSWLQSSFPILEAAIPTMKQKKKMLFAGKFIKGVRSLRRKIK